MRKQFQVKTLAETTSKKDYLEQDNEVPECGAKQRHSPLIFIDVQDMTVVEVHKSSLGFSHGSLWTK